MLVCWFGVYTLLVQEIITMNRLYCSTNQRSNNMLIYVNIFMEF